MSTDDDAEQRAYPVPEDGGFFGGVYRNTYFDLAYPLPSGWQEGLKGPHPSYSGYYVLATPSPRLKIGATLLIAAQDTFFAAKPTANAMAMIRDLERSVSPANGMKIEREPRVVEIAGRSFVRLEISGDPLSRIVLATDIRCHVVIFTITGADPALLDKVASSLDDLAPPVDDAAETESARPLCIRDYATPDTLLRRVEPLPADPKFLKIPVRIIIGTDGGVKHVHVIRAFPEQKRNIEAALAQWLFKPPRVNGRPAEIETGLVFEFKPTAPGRSEAPRRHP